MKSVRVRKFAQGSIIYSLTFLLSHILEESSSLVTMEMSLANRLFSLPLSVTVLAIQNVEGDGYAFNNTGPPSMYKSVSRMSFHFCANHPHLCETETGYICSFLNMTLYNEALVTPRYIFLEPFQMTQLSPYLYNNAGVCSWLLVPIFWLTRSRASSGAGSKAKASVPRTIFTFAPITAVTTSPSSPSQQYTSYACGLGLILDNTLKVVQSVESQGSFSPLIIIYETQQADLSAEDIDSGLGWITNCWFQEIALSTNVSLNGLPSTTCPPRSAPPPLTLSNLLARAATPPSLGTTSTSTRSTKTTPATDSLRSPHLHHLQNLRR